MTQEGHESHVTLTQGIPVEEQTAFDAYVEEYTAFIAATPAAALARGLAMQRLAIDRQLRYTETENGNLTAENRDLTEMNKRLQAQSERDPYNPEVYTRHGWRIAMKDRVAELRRNKQGAAILALDLDGFKEFNDKNSEGHLGGDKALGAAGGLMKSVLRPGDLVARRSGDEYLITLLDIDNVEQAAIAAEKIRLAISQLSSLLETPVELAASIGIALIGKDAIQELLPGDENLFAALDAAYLEADQVQFEGAKNAGKNRIGVPLEDGSIKTAFVTNISLNPARPKYSVRYEKPTFIPTHR